MAIKGKRVAGHPRYRRSVHQSDAMTPERRLAALDGWEGYWVAVKDGEVVAAAHSSRELVRVLAEKGPSGKGAIAQFVTPPSSDITIGVG